MTNNLSPRSYQQKSNSGFTLIELVIYAGLTAIVIGLFGAILVTILRVQGEQSSSVQVSSELNFLMTTMKRHIHEARQINLIDSMHLSLIKDESTEPITTALISYDSDLKTISVTEDGLNPSVEQISSDRILIDDLVFEKFQNLSNPSSTAISIIMTASANSTDPAKKSTRTIRGTASSFLQSQ
jgi:type II secretory pathway pseudopilin PulG